MQMFHKRNFWKNCITWSMQGRQDEKPLFTLKLCSTLIHCTTAELTHSGIILQAAELFSATKDYVFNVFLRPLLLSGILMHSLRQQFFNHCAAALWYPVNGPQMCCRNTLTTFLYEDVPESLRMCWTKDGDSHYDKSRVKSTWVDLWAITGDPSLLQPKSWVSVESFLLESDSPIPRCPWQQYSHDS